MNLPSSYARCQGVQVDGEWREGCEKCLRRTSPPGDHQRWMEPPPIITFFCEYEVGPDEGHEEDAE